MTRFRPFRGLYLLVLASIGSFYFGLGAVLLVVLATIDLEVK